MRSVLLLLPLFAAACASDWKQVSADAHPALKPDVWIATLERGSSTGYERRTEIQANGKPVFATTVEELMPHVRQLATADVAIAYADLVRRVRVTDSGARGMPLTPDRRLEGPGGSGSYSRSDAAGWGVEFEPTARPSSGGFEVSHVVLIPPIPHRELPNAATPWRLVLVREVVLPGGSIRFLEEKTLTNGQDAARFAGY